VRRTSVVLAVALGAVLFATALGTAQGAILEFALDPETVSAAPGGEAVVTLSARNTSVYEADDLELLVDTTDLVPVATSDPSIVEVIPPFGEAKIRITLVIPADAPEGELELAASAVYSYCIDDSCFLLEEPLVLRVSVEVGAIAGPVAEPRGPGPWPALLAGLLVGGLVGALFVARAPRLRVASVVGLILVAGLGIVYGALRRQPDQAQGIGAVLCTSCVGLEAPGHEPPRLTQEGATMLEALDREITLLVFSATWCHSCPIAKAFVDEVAAASPWVSVRVIDVAAEPGLAVVHGIVRSGRTVVPAIVREDTGEMVLGIEDLERRVLLLLGVAP